MKRKFIQHIFLGMLLVTFVATGVAPLALAETTTSTSNPAPSPATKLSPDLTKQIREKQDRAMELRKQADQLRLRVLREVNNGPLNAAKRPQVLPPPASLKTKVSSNARVEAAKNFDDAIKNLREARNKLKTDVNNIEHRKKVLTDLIDLLIRRGKDLEERIKDHPIRDTLEDTILKEIEADRVALEALKIEVQNAKTIDELKEISRKIHEQHRDFTNRRARLLMLLWYFGRLEKIHVERLADRAEKIEVRLTELEKQGKDVTELKEFLKQANDIITRVQTTIKEEKKKLNETEITDVRLKEIKEILKTIKQDLKKVHDLFRKVHDGIEDL